jgi:hypothetical protein
MHLITRLPSVLSQVGLHDLEIIISAFSFKTLRLLRDADYLDIAEAMAVSSWKVTRKLTMKDRINVEKGGEAKGVALTSPSI